MADPDSSASGEPSNAPVPVVGAISISGRQRSMEDAISVRPNLCSPNLSRGRPIDFFAVYDGHGGPHVILHLFYHSLFFFDHFDFT